MPHAAGCLRDRSIGTADFITGWFYRRPSSASGDWERANDGLALESDEPVGVSELKRGNVLEWLSWSLHVKEPEQLEPEEAAELEASYAMLERSLSTLRRRFTFARGYDEVRARGGGPGRPARRS